MDEEIDESDPMMKIAKETVKFEKALSMTGYGIFNIILLIISGGCLMCVIIETMCMMIIIPASECDLNLSLHEKGLLSSVSFLGVVASSYLWGYLADTKGRKPILIFSLLISFVLTVICSFITLSWVFILMRFINGFFIGGASAVVYAFTGEFHDDHYRPKVVTWMAVFVAFGLMYIPGIAWLVLPIKWTYYIESLNLTYNSWRLLMIIYTIPSLFFGIALILLPESPKYMMTQKEYDKTLNVLRTMYKWNFCCTQKSAIPYPVDELLWNEVSTSPNKTYGIWKSFWIQTVPLYKKPLLQRTLMVSILHFGIYGANAGMAMWYPEILNRISHYEGNNSYSFCDAVLYQSNTTSNVDSSACKHDVNLDVFQVNFYIGLAYAMVYILIGSIINIIGKKRLIIGITTITGICGLCTQFVYGYEPIQILIGIYLMGGSGIGIVNAIIVDLYPTQIRAMALSVSLMFGRVGAMVGSNIIGPIIYNFCDFTFYFLAFDFLAMIAIVVLLPTSVQMPVLN